MDYCLKSDASLLKLVCIDFIIFLIYSDTQNYSDILGFRGYDRFKCSLIILNYLKSIDMQLNIQREHSKPEMEKPLQARNKE